MVGSLSLSSTLRGNSFLSVLRRSRKIINKIVKPHPSFEFPRSPSPQRAPAIHSIKNLPQLSNTGWDTSNVLTVGCDNPGANSKLPSVLSPCNQHIPDRNGRHQGTTGRTGGTSVLRRTKGTIHSPSLIRDENATDSLTPSLAEYRPLIATVALSEPYQSRHEPLTPIPEQADSPDLAGQILLSCDSTNSLALSSADSAIHFVDEASGIVISRIQRASGSRISAEQFVLEPSSLRSSMSLHIGSPPSCAATDIDAHIESLPSFVLTLPTPVSPPLPIFSPEIHFTTGKPLSAAEAAAPGDPVSSLPQCDHVPSGKLCRACEMQMLGRRVWFQNAEGAAVSSPSGVGLRDDEGGHVQDDEDDDIEDPGQLAIEAPPPGSSGLALLLSQRVKAILRKVRSGLGLLFPSLSTLPLDNTHRKSA
ncbi:hypothetical protein EDB85DRAFT_1923053 [Lactarius pseudohatsudake]|nr:hypothetical protein EDB85DRAFT_1923053 [Lactarius pseudohatsudake]